MLQTKNFLPAARSNKWLLGIVDVQYSVVAGFSYACYVKRWETAWGWAARMYYRRGSNIKSTEDARACFPFSFSFFPLRTAAPARVNNRQYLASSGRVRAGSLPQARLVLVACPLPQNLSSYFPGSFLLSSRDDFNNIFLLQYHRPLHEPLCTQRHDSTFPMR